MGKNNYIQYENNTKIKKTSLLTVLCCSGWMYVTTPATARRLAQAAQGPSFFWIDDVWVKDCLSSQLILNYKQVTGYLAEKLGIHHTELNKHWTFDISAIKATKLDQSPDLYREDFVAGPTDRLHDKFCKEHLM